MEKADVCTRRVMTEAAPLAGNSLPSLVANCSRENFTLKQPNSRKGKRKFCRMIKAKDSGPDCELESQLCHY